MGIPFSGVRRGRDTVVVVVSDEGSVPSRVPGPGLEVKLLARPVLSAASSPTTRTVPRGKTPGQTPIDALVLETFAVLTSNAFLLCCRYLVTGL
jgi:hypothetical protein